MSAVVGELTVGELSAYRNDGHVTLRGAFGSADLRTWQGECERLWARLDISPDNPRVQWRDQSAGGVVADRIDPVLDISPAFAALANGARLLGIASTALGQPATVLKGKLIMKRPGTLGYSMHQDYPYWEFLGVPPEDFVNITIALDRFDALGGATEVFPRYHERSVPPPHGTLYDADETQMDLSGGRLLELAPGDLVIFNSLIPHRSGPNRSPHSRRGIFLTYAAARYEGIAQRYEQGRVDRTGRNNPIAVIQGKTPKR